MQDKNSINPKRKINDNPIKLNKRAALAGASEESDEVVLAMWADSAISIANMEANEAKIRAQFKIVDNLMLKSDQRLARILQKEATFKAQDAASY